MGEIRRSLGEEGLLVLTVLAGEPEAGLPAVQMYTREMFEDMTAGFEAIEIAQYDDMGCTGRPDYRIWFGLLEK